MRWRCPDAAAAPDRRQRTYLRARPWVYLGLAGLALLIGSPVGCVVGLNAPADTPGWRSVEALFSAAVLAALAFAGFLMVLAGLLGTWRAVAEEREQEANSDAGAGGG